MKKSIFFVFACALVTSVEAMNHLGKIEEKALNVFKIDYFQFAVIQELFKNSAPSDALRSLKAFSLTHKKTFQSLRREKHITIPLIGWLYSYYYDREYDIHNLFQAIQPILNSDELNAALVECENSFALLCDAQKKNDWSHVLPFLLIIEKKRLLSLMSSYYWYDLYNNSPTKKTLLGYALELNAPKELIHHLISRGCRFSKLHPTTVPPCLIVIEKILDLLKGIEENKKFNLALLNDERLNSKASKEEFLIFSKNRILDLVLPHKDEKEVERLLDLNDFLIDLGASINDAFFKETAAITPLLASVKAHRLEMVKYVLSKGAYCSVDTLWAAISNALMSKDQSVEILHDLCKASSQSVLSAVFQKLILLLNQAQETNNYYGCQKCYELCQILIGNYIDITAVNEQGLTVIDRAREGKANGHVIALLLQKRGHSDRKKTDQECIAREVKSLSFFDEKVVPLNDAMLKIVVKANRPEPEMVKRLLSKGAHCSVGTLWAAIRNIRMSKKESVEMLHDLCEASSQSVLCAVFQKLILLFNQAQETNNDYSFRRCYELCQILIGNYIDLTAVDEEGLTVLDRAKEWEANEVVIDLLLKKIGDIEQKKAAQDSFASEVESLFFLAEKVMTIKDAIEKKGIVYREQIASVLTEAKNLFMYGINGDALDDISFLTDALLVLIWTVPSDQDGRELLKLMADQKRIVLGYPLYGRGTPVYHYIVTMLEEAKEILSFENYTIKLKEMISLIEWLAQKGFKDTLVTARGETAEAMAERLGMDEVILFSF